MIGETEVGKARRVAHVQGGEVILSSIEVERFRMMSNQSFQLGEDITAIIGQNGTMKSTLLGIIGEPFRFREPKDAKGEAYKTIDDKFF